MTEAEWAAFRERDYTQDVSELMVNRDELLDLAAGYVPRTVQVLARMALEPFEEFLQRNAEKPRRKAKGSR